MHIGPLQFPRPDWVIAFDVDPPKAVASRKRMLDMAATDRLLVAGMHLPFPGLGYVDRDASLLEERDLLRMSQVSARTLPPSSVIPAKAGIQAVPRRLDPGFRRGDDWPSSGVQHASSV